MAARIALCTTCGNRLSFLRRTLPANLRDNADFPNVVHVVLDYGSTDGLGPYIAQQHGDELRIGRLVYYRFEPEGSFRMAHAKNLAGRCGLLEGADILANIDADNWTGKGFARLVAQKFAQADLEAESIFLRFRENDEGPGHQVTDRQPQGSAGRLVLSRGAFLAAGGYDEAYVFWGPDDRDLRVRLERLGYVRHGMDARRFGRAIWHGNDVRFAIKDPGAPQDWGDPDLRRITDVAQGGPVANQGRIGCGRVWRNFDPAPIEISPLPTRIFGIGLHKTATTSLAAALTRLGWPCAHWQSPRWARIILEEIKAGRTSRDLEAYPAVADLPVGLVYRELDRLYPGSKFILTVRRPEAWIASVEAHWGRYRAGWLDDGGSEAIHFALYGRTDFDRERFLTRYLKHNAAVVRYFAARPQDLLVMDMDAGAGWAELCGFLGVPIPNVPYPHEFETPRSAGPETGSG